MWHTKKADLIIMYGKTPKEQAGKISKYIGTMKPLPEWVMNGAVVGL